MCSSDLYSESFGNLDDAIRHFRGCKATAENSQTIDHVEHPFTAYLGTSSPGTPAAKSWATASGTLRLQLIEPDGDVAIDETLNSLEEYRVRARGLQAQRDLNGAGWSVKGFYVAGNNLFESVSGV